MRSLFRDAVAFITFPLEVLCARLRRLCTSIASPMCFITGTSILQLKIKVFADSYFAHPSLIEAGITKFEVTDLTEIVKSLNAFIHAFNIQLQV